MAEPKRGPHAAAERVERLMPGAYCVGRWDEDAGRTVYKVWGYDGCLGIGFSAMQAWCAADVELQRRQPVRWAADTAPKRDPEDVLGRRYRKGRDVEEMIGGAP